jgi:proteasome lid subunit RPN8/RPN11
MKEMESGASTGQAIWNPPECPFQVEYSVRALDDIRLAVVDAFFSLPRGGAEIGGVLLGNYRDGRVSITGYLSLDCEHALGPSFTLSQRDQERLAALIEPARNDKERRPVGWYHSHTRSEIFLSDADLEIHKRFFPETWQVALVLRPHTFQPCRAGFFFRERDGSVHAAATYAEFVLEALPMLAVPMAQAAGPRASQPDSQPAAPPAMPFVVHSTRQPGSRRGPEPPELTLVAEPEPLPHLDKPAPEPRPLQAPPPRERRDEPIAAATVDPPAVQPPALEIPVPKFLEPPQQHSRRGVAVLLTLAAVLALGAGVYQTRQSWLPRLSAMVAPPPVPNPSLGLFVSDHEGELQIHWDRGSQPVLTAASGVLTLNDGGPLPKEIRLDAEHLRSGSYTLLRQSERVDASLTVNQQDGRAIREATAFFGKLPPPVERLPDPALVKERDSLTLQLDRAETELDAEVDKNRKLQRNVDQLKKQLADQMRRRMGNQVK